MRVLEHVVVVGVIEKSPGGVQQIDHRIELRSVARGEDVEGQGLAGLGGEAKVVVVAGLDRAVDQDWQLDGLRMLAIVVGFVFEYFLARRDIEPVDRGSMRGDQPEIMAARLSGRIYVKTGLHRVVLNAEDRRGELGCGEQNRGRAL